MNNADDEFGKRVLASLKSTPPLGPKEAAEEKAKFLLLGENLRQGIIPGTSRPDIQQDNRLSTAFLRRRPTPIFKFIFATLMALIVLVGSSLTVYASQASLPGDALYPLKAVSEDIRLYITRSPQAKLDITLEYTNRRVDEITEVVATGKSLHSQASDRFDVELDSALRLAAQMEDAQMQIALREIKSHAQSQGMTIEELINQLPMQSDPAIVHFQERLREQVTLSAIGENDPQSFRTEIRERQQRRSETHQPKPAEDENSSTPDGGSTTPQPTKPDEQHDNGNGQPSQAPGNDGSNPGQGNHNPGNGNHGNNPSHTPKP